MKYTKKQKYTIDGDIYEYMGHSNSSYADPYCFHVFFSRDKSKRIRIQTKNLKNYKIEEVIKNE